MQFLFCFRMMKPLPTSTFYGKRIEIRLPPEDSDDSVMDSDSDTESKELLCKNKGIIIPETDDDDDDEISVTRMPNDNEAESETDDTIQRIKE